MLNISFISELNEHESCQKYVVRLHDMNCTMVKWSDAKEYSIFYLKNVVRFSRWQKASAVRTTERRRLDARLLCVTLLLLLLHIAIRAIMCWSTNTCSRWQRAGWEWVSERNKKKIPLVINLHYGTCDFLLLLIWILLKGLTHETPEKSCNAMNVWLVDLSVYCVCVSYAGTHLPFRSFYWI